MLHRILRDLGKNELSKSIADMNHPTQGSSKINAQSPSSLSELAQAKMTAAGCEMKWNEMECGTEENEHVASHYMKLAADVHRA